MKMKKDKKQTEKTKEKMRRAALKRFRIKENHPWFGQHHTEKTKLRISQKEKGKLFQKDRKKDKEKEC